MKRLVITGASGFIGRSASLLFSRYGIKILAVDVFDRPPAEFASTDIEYLSCDVGKSNELKCAMMQFGADTILSLAWVGTEPSKRNDRSLQRVNIENTMHTLSVAAECGVRRFIGVGSAREIEYEYALTTGSALPDDCYGEAKYETHKSCMLEAQNAGIECIWAIITNAYGPSCPENRLVPYLLEHFTSGRSPILTSCEQYYDLIFVEDVARALFLLGENGKPGKTYLIGVCIRTIFRSVYIFLWILCSMRSMIRANSCLGYGILSTGSVRTRLRKAKAGISCM